MMPSFELPRPGARCLFLAIALWSAALPALPAETLRIGGTGGALGTMRLLGEAFHRANPGVDVRVMPSLGSGGGVKALVAGALDVAVTSRPLTGAELEWGAQAFEYGRTPFVFAVSVSNPVDGLTLDDVADIYWGRTQRWPDAVPVRLVLRPLGDSDSAMIRSMSPAIRDAKRAAEGRTGMMFAMTEQETADLLEGIKGAFGPASLSLILSERRRLKALRLGGVAPTPEAIRSGAYPWYKSMFFVVGPQPRAVAGRFVEFMSSEEARAVLDRTGHWVPDDRNR